MPNRILGKASYYALRIGGVTTITATGTMPNFNDKADFDQLPLRISPPQFAFYFIQQQIGLPALRPFTHSEIIVYPQDVSFIWIRDATGLHQIQIAEVIPQSPTTSQPNPEDPGYCVYSQLNDTSLAIAKCNEILPAVYSNIYGPETYSKCEAYVTSNTGM